MPASSLGSATAGHWRVTLVKKPHWWWECMHVAAAGDRLGHFSQSCIGHRTLSSYFQVLKVTLTGAHNCQ